MASVGHIAVGLAAARVQNPGRIPTWSSMVLWSGLSLLPDTDVIGFALGVQYADSWGHRGATHSLAMSIACGLVIGLGARWLKQPAIRTALLATAVLASHAVLDTMTDGGLGCALLWPLDLTRYFAPWRPIPVAPIGLSFFSLNGATVALVELVLFCPLLPFALRRPRGSAGRVGRGVMVTLWVALVWLIASTDPARDAIVGFVVREDTTYAAGFSESAFRTLRPGRSAQEVRQLLGPPVGESWFYPPKDRPFESAEERSAAASPSECLVLHFESGVLVTAFDARTCGQMGITSGMSLDAVDDLVGEPAEECWRYTWSPGHRSHRMRMVCFASGTVHTIFRQWIWPE